jgi:hypothetical protein
VPCGRDASRCGRLLASESKFRRGLRKVPNKRGPIKNFSSGPLKKIDSQEALQKIKRVTARMCAQVVCEHCHSSANST